MRATILLGLVVVAACGGGGGGDDVVADDSGDDTGSCDTPLDAATLDALTHSYWAVPAVEIQPGDQRDINLGTVELGAAFSEVSACATWSIAPTTGASIDPVTGMVQID